MLIFLLIVWNLYQGSRIGELEDEAAKLKRKLNGTPYE